MKKLFAVLVAMALVLTVVGTTFALAAEGDDKGTITITNAYPGSEYKVYKMLDFTPSNEAGDKGIYTIEAGWEDFFATAPATNYFVLETNGGQVTVVPVEGLTDETLSQDVAKAALNYAIDNDIEAIATQTAPAAAENEERSTVTFADLDLGYYAVDTSAGTMVGLLRATNNKTAAEKNEMPKIEKYVQEDKEMNNADEGWGKVNDANIGQVVNYKSTITVGHEAVNYIMHDTMEAGLTFDAESVRVEDKNGTVDPSNYEVIEGGIVKNGQADGHTFDIVFKDSYIATLVKDDTITVYYSATLNEDATIGPDDGNDNEVYLTAGEKNEWETKKDKTSTYTWLMDVLKDNESNEPLPNATFRLLDTSKVDPDNNKDGVVYFVKTADTILDDGTAVPTYMVVNQGTENAVDTITTDETGKFYIVGLDEGSYKLDETAAPAGYNKLANPIDVVITSSYDDDALTAKYFIGDSDPATIEVENKSGGLLPETGGIGTIIFYVVGGLLMLAAFVFLVAKKRMATFA